MGQKNLHQPAPLDPDLLAAITDHDPHEREAAVALLLDDGGPEAVRLLFEELHDPSEMVRAAVADALGWMRSGQALSALRGALHDPSDVVRAAAARALERHRDPSALPELRALEEDADADVRRAVAEAIEALDPTRAAAAHARRLMRDGDGTTPRAAFKEQVFRDFYDHPWNFPWLRSQPGRTFANVEFQRCRFEHCVVSVTNNPRRRSTIRNARLIDCDIRNCSLDAALVEDVVVDGLETSGLCIIWGAAFKHLTMRGRLGSFKFNPWHGPSAKPGLERAFAEANAAFYATVDWALDISEAEFEDVDLDSVPGHLVRRDHESQVLVTREKALMGAWRTVNLDDTYWPTSLDFFLKSGMPSIVLAAPKRNRAYRRLLDGLRELRNIGVAEPD